MTEDNFKWTDELVMEIIGLTHRAGYHKEPAKVYDRVIQFKQSKLQSQDKQVGWEILELIFWSGEKTTDFLVIQNWLRGDKRYEKWSIYSVKRLSDGEVFTIGAKLEWGGGSISPKSRLQLMAGPIISFSIREDNMVYAEVSDKIFFPITHLHKAKPKPQPSSIERIEVLKIGNRVDIKTPEWPQAYYLQFCTNKQIWEDKFPAIKQAIEQAINSKEEADYVGSISKDKFWLSTLRDIKEVEVNNKKFIPQSEVDTIREETWKAARETTFSFKGEQDFPNPKIKYPTLQDYLNSLSKETKPKEEDKPVIIEDNDRCGICGGEMVYIRGRYPNTDKRKVCPTCTTERLEQISDLCSPEYGKAYQNKN